MRVFFFFVLFFCCCFFCSGAVWNFSDVWCDICDSSVTLFLDSDKLSYQ